MEPQVDPPLIVASLLVLAILGGSLALWIRHIQRPRGAIIEYAGIPSWPIGWANFGIFVCALIATSFFVQIVAIGLLVEPSPDPSVPRELTPGLAVLAILTFQLPLLFVFYALRRFYPGQFASRLSHTSLSFVQAFCKTLPLFIMYLPIIWLVAFIWGYALVGLETLGLIEQAKPQELVEVFGSGGDPLLIVLIALFAVALAPLVEELVFRGGVYRFLKSQTSILAAQVISGMLFSMIHQNLYSFLPLAVVGICLARVYEKSGNILVPICFHALFNAFTLTIVFLTSISDIPIEQL